MDSGEGACTAELKIHYLRPVSDGKLWGEGKVIQKGKNLIVGQGEIKDDAGQLVAFGTATFILTQTEASHKAELSLAEPTLSFGLAYHGHPMGEETCAREGIQYLLKGPG